MRGLFVLFLVGILPSIAAADHRYYPEAFKEIVHKGLFKDDDLKRKTFELLTKKHIQIPTGSDELADHCKNNIKANCYGQISLGYTRARKVLFGRIHLQKENGSYFLKDVYCERKFKSAQLGPNRIPDHTKINCEHTWPQSKFSGLFPKGIQKSDLHHLYPTDSRANSTRGNYPFAEVKGKPVNSNCTASSIGTNFKNSRSFEPPKNHRGNVARALFYFSIRYKIPISQNEEIFLRRWHLEDPVDASEVRRNDIIWEVQGNRNPFIDYPEMLDLIANF